ncbi:MAG: hypothetical protein D6728_00110 [Cyanobacteria bacterium J055]|nr:MAG: hypothetical protein D6728_00110 [Cyanobacteria bacterium J055]
MTTLDGHNRERNETNILSYDIAAKLTLDLGNFWVKEVSVIGHWSLVIWGWLPGRVLMINFG